MNVSRIAIRNNVYFAKQQEAVKAEEEQPVETAPEPEKSSKRSGRGPIPEPVREDRGSDH